MNYENLYKAIPLFLLVFKVNAQIQVVDSHSKEGIAFVEIYSSKGDLVALTDINGIINKEKISQIQGLDESEVSFDHFAYDELIISKEAFKSSKEIELAPRTYHLREVIVKAKKPNYKFIELHGFYRSYQIDNDALTYYTDGVITYCLPLKSKNKIQNKKIAYRLLVNKKSERNERARPVAVSILMAGPPRPDKRLTTNYLKKNGCVFKPDKNGFKNYIVKEGDTVGVVSSQPGENLSRLEISFISEKNPEERKLFGYYSSIDSHYATACFKTKNVDGLNLKSLLYHKEIVKLRFKHKKDKNYQQIEAIHEFFVTKTEFVSRFDKKGYSKWFGFGKRSNYSNAFWKNFSNLPYYQPLPKGVLRELAAAKQM